MVFFTAFGAYSATSRPACAGTQHGDAARLAELEGRRAVAVDKGLLDRRLVRLMDPHDFCKAYMNGEQALRQFTVERRLDRARGDEAEAVAAHDDEAPAGAAETGIDPEDANRRVHQGLG